MLHDGIDLKVVNYVGAPLIIAHEHDVPVQAFQLKDICEWGIKKDKNAHRSHSEYHKVESLGGDFLDVLNCISKIGELSFAISLLLGATGLTAAHSSGLLLTIIYWSEACWILRPFLLSGLRKSLSSLAYLWKLLRLFYMVSEDK